MPDDYSRNGGPSDFDSRGGIPSLERPRLDPLIDGHWANAPTDSVNNMVEESLDDTLIAARHRVSPFFQRATDEEKRVFICFFYNRVCVFNDCLFFVGVRFVHKIRKKKYEIDIELLLS
jgi:hypothetical protein